MKKPTARKAAKRIAGKPRAAARDSPVEAVFRTYPAPVKARLLALRRLIFDTADTTRASAPWKRR
jgi:hypothetical protein